MQRLRARLVLSETVPPSSSASRRSERGRWLLRGLNGAVCDALPDSLL